MSNKKILCYKIDFIKRNEYVGYGEESLAKIIEKIFQECGNNLLINRDGKTNDGDYLSLEKISEVKPMFKDDFRKIDENYLFFRIGKKKDIEGFLKRNKNTGQGEEILNKQQQEKYDLETCTYLLIDKRRGILLELFGQIAPSAKTFLEIINIYVKNNINSEYEVSIKNIMTKEMVESYKNAATSLNRIKYDYAIPSEEIFKSLGLDINQINALKEVDAFKVEVNIKGRPNYPLTKIQDKIKFVINAFSDCTKDIKDTLKFVGNTTTTSSSSYTFKEEKVTYSTPISIYRIENGEQVKLNLDELTCLIYEKMDKIYKSKESDISRYILE